MIQRPRGTRDFLPEEAYKRSVVKNRMISIIERWGYQEVQTPTFEHLELFTMKSGEGVLGEIYNFKDKGDREMALRPELTAPVMRMYVSELQNAPKPQRLHYFGNCFRYERPQRGRFREFWQLGCELIGGRHSDSEAEVIALASTVINEIGISGDIHVGYLGLVRSMLSQIPPQERPLIMRFIDKKETKALEERLCEINADHLGLQELLSLKGREALDKAMDMALELPKHEANFEGPATAAGTDSKGIKDLAVKDTKETGAKEAGQRSAMAGREVKPELGLNEFSEMVDLLDYYDVNYTIDFQIVRGLEYYTGTVFEVYAEGLGAQSQICGGGTYQLASLFGGAETSSTGFGLGFDRIMEVVGNVPSRKPPLVLVFMPEVRGQALSYASKLRKVVPVVVDVMGRGLGAQLKAAASMGAEKAVIIGKKEVESGLLTFRDMISGNQESISFEDIMARFES